MGLIKLYQDKQRELNKIRKEAADKRREEHLYAEHMKLYEEATRPGYCHFCKVTYSRTFWGEDCPARDFPRHDGYWQYKLALKKMKQDLEFAKLINPYAFK